MLPASYGTYAAAILAAGGLLACFFGHRLFRYVLGIFGFYAGASMTTQMMGAASHWGLLLAAVVGGLVGAGLMIAAYFVGVGLVGAGLAALGVNIVWRFIGGEPPTAVLVIACVLGALAALSVVRYVVILGTALAGAWTLIVGGLALSGDHAAARAASAGDVWILYPLDPLPEQWWLLPLWLVLAIAGAIVQLAMPGKKKGAVPARRKGLPDRRA
jgi:hypothetical protein